MSLGDKIKDFFGVGAEDDYEGGEDEYIQGRQDRDDDDNLYADSEPSRKSKVTNFNTTTINTTTQLRVVLVKPERFADASTIADHLNAKRTVVLNLESTNKEVSRRLVDFLSGVAYANNGEMKRVAASTYIITPFNVDIVGDLLDELENSGAFLNN